MIEQNAFQMYVDNIRICYVLVHVQVHNKCDTVLNIVISLTRLLSKREKRWLSLCFLALYQRTSGKHVDFYSFLEYKNQSMKSFKFTIKNSNAPANKFTTNYSLMETELPARILVTFHRSMFDPKQRINQSCKPEFLIIRSKFVLAQRTRGCYERELFFYVKKKYTNILVFHL